MKRPRVIVHGEVSVDGRLTLARDLLLLFGDERWQAVAGSGSDVYERLKRTFQPQVILEGSGSFVSGDAEPEPLPPVAGDPKPLYQDFLPDAVAHRPGHRGWFTVVDSGGRVRWAHKEWPAEEWAGWHLLVLVARRTPPAYLDYLRRESIPYLAAGEGPVDLQPALDKLGSRLGVTSVLCTSPGRLGGALLRAGLVDEISLELFPAVIGGFDTPSLFESPALRTDEWPTRLKLISAQVHTEGRVGLRYEVVPDNAP